MITDPIFYRLFATSPETFFLVLGMTADAAAAMAECYQYAAIEFKETAHRADGVFEPKSSDLPVYFLEVQYYPAPSVYADVLAKAYTYLKQHNPGQAFRAVVLFGSRALEPVELTPYQPLLDAAMLQRVYLDEMAVATDAPLGLAIVNLIGQSEDAAPTAARELVARAKDEVEDESLRANLVELIETIIMYKLPRLGREEIQTMLQVHDIRETRVYQEAREEGLLEGIEKGIEKGARKTKLDLIPKLAAEKMSATAIAKLLDLDLKSVRKALAKK